MLPHLSILLAQRCQLIMYGHWPGHRRLCRLPLPVQVLGWRCLPRRTKGLGTGTRCCGPGCCCQGSLPIAYCSLQLLMLACRPSLTFAPAWLLLLLLLRDSHVSLDGCIPLPHRIQLPEQCGHHTLRA